MIFDFIHDPELLQFILNNDGRYYQNHACCFYKFDSKDKHTDVVFVNDVIEKYYDFCVEPFIAFGQDVFGNQFCYAHDYISLFNIETGTHEPIVDRFTTFFDAIEGNIEYYCATSIVDGLENADKLAHGFRLCPKKPFIIGGEYSLDNLYLLDMFDCLSYNADIAKQIYNLPD